MNESDRANRSSIVQSTKNVAETIGLMIASGQGTVGSVIGVGFSAFMTSKRLDRIQDTIQHFNRRLIAIEKSIDPDRIASDEYFHLCATGFEAASKEHRDFKRRCLGIMLANFGKGERATGYEIEDHFLELAAVVDFHHLEVLELLHRSGVKAKDDQWIGSWYIFDSCPILQLLGRNVATAAFQLLAGYGVIGTKGEICLMHNVHPMGLWWSSSYSITRLGEQFMGYLANDV
ncbi:MAG: hypothetical protein ACYC26_08435 [Phycisphaerales bacterium]